MKKILLVLLFFLISHPQTWGQGEGSYIDDFNAVTFGYGHALQQNMHNSGLGGGLYLDYSFKMQHSQNWRLGIYSLIGFSGSSDNISRYKSENRDIGIGVAVGNYSPGFSRSYQLFWSGSLGFKSSKNIGESSSIDGKYWGKQRTYFYTLGININLQKRSETACNPRTELWLHWQKPIDGFKNATWNGQDTETAVWDMEYVQAQAKHSFYNFLFCDIYISPQLIAAYSYESGMAESKFGIGAGLSIHEKGRDNIFSGYYMIKFNKEFDHNTIIIGLQFNLARIIL